MILIKIWIENIIYGNVIILYCHLNVFVCIILKLFKKNFFLINGFKLITFDFLDIIHNYHYLNSSMYFPSELGMGNFVVWADVWIVSHDEEILKSANGVIVTIGLSSL